jgi:hypothetical protein
MNHLALSLINYQHVRDRIRTEHPDLDEMTLSDTVEGLTDLNEIVTAIIRSTLIDQAMAAGLRLRLKEMQERLDRLEDRASKRRGIARDVMLEAEIKSITAPDFTVSIRPGTPSLAVTDEKAIPEAYWLPQPSKLDRQGLLTTIKRGSEIPGVLLSNAQPVLSVRAK